MNILTSNRPTKEVLHECADYRLGRGAWAIWLAPIGAVILFLASMLCALALKDIIAADKLDPFTIVVMIFATLYFFACSIALLRLFRESFISAQQVCLFDDGLTLSNYVGRIIFVPSDRIVKVERTDGSAQRRFMTLLNKKGVNYRIVLQGEKSYFVNGQLEGAERLFSQLVELANKN